MNVAFIGTGIMGSRMAGNILKAGYEVKVYNRTPSKLEKLITKGALLSYSAQEAAENADVVFTMLSAPKAVAETAMGEKGFLSSMGQNTIWVDCSTVNPSFSKEMAAAAKKHKVRFIDAPVAGTKQPAEKGELIIYAGGNKKDVEEVTPLLKVIGKKIFYAGENGMGTSIKMVINMMLAGSMEIFSEALILGESLGLSKEQLSDVLIGASVTAPFLTAKKEKIDNRNYEADFPLKWILKDIQLILQSAKEKGKKLPTANSLSQIYSSAAESGMGEIDFSGVHEFLKLGGSHKTPLSKTKSH